LRSQPKYFVGLPFFLLLPFLGVPAHGQQANDPNFNTRIIHPAYVKTHPKVLFDEAHFNFHKSVGTYKAFVDLITNDGYRVTANKQKFSRESLRSYDILVVAGPLGAKEPGDPKAGQSAFTDQECDAVKDWVFRGGRLLLLTDHEPVASAAEGLTKRLGIDVSKRVVLDQSNHMKGFYPALIEYSRDHGLLAEHPIIRGRSPSEQVNKVLVFSGQSLRCSAACSAILELAGTAYENLPNGEKISAAGRAQALAFHFGKGRVVITGDAGLLSAQLVTEDVSGKGDIQTHPWGMNFPGNDNRQLTLNILHWLSGLLP
jgi:hypothetical protein